MASEQLFRDLGDIHSRLFDHRPMLQGEISYMVKQFEEKREWREEVRLQQSLEYSREIVERIVPDCEVICCDKLTKLNQTVKAANKICTDILNIENSEKGANWLSEKQDARLQDWHSFMAVMTQKSQVVDNEHSAQFERMQNYYEDLEKKLQPSQSLSS